MVMVSHTHKFIFLKIQKTAGTTVEIAFEPFCRPPGAVVTEKTPTISTKYGIVGRRMTKPWRTKRYLGFIDWSNHMKHRALGEERRAQYLKITTVRNPFDVAVSKYHHALTFRGAPEAKDFDETRRRFAETILTKSNNSDYRVVHVDGRFVVDRVIRFERLAEGLSEVAREVAPEAAPVLLAQTKDMSGRRKRSVADYYDEATIAKVRTDAAWVFERFGCPDWPGEAAPAPSALNPQVQT